MVQSVPKHPKICKLRGIWKSFFFPTTRYLQSPSNPLESSTNCYWSNRNCEMKITVWSDVPLWSLMGRYQCAIFSFSNCSQILGTATQFNYKFINKNLFEHTVLMGCTDFYYKTPKQNLYIHHLSALDLYSTIHHQYAYMNKTFWRSPAIPERKKSNSVSNCNLMTW